MSALGDLIRDYLDTHPGVKKQDIARRAGVSAQSISGWLSGSKSRPKDSSILGLATALEVPVSVVVDRITQDRGLIAQKADPADLPQNMQVLISTVRKLSPEQVRIVAQLAASLAEQQGKGKKPRR